MRLYYAYSHWHLSLVVSAFLLANFATAGFAVSYGDRVLFEYKGEYYTQRMMEIFRIVEGVSKGNGSPINSATLEPLDGRNWGNELKSFASKMAFLVEARVNGGYVPAKKIVDGQFQKSYKALEQSTLFGQFWLPIGGTKSEWRLQIANLIILNQFLARKESGKARSKEIQEKIRYMVGAWQYQQLLKWNEN